MPSINSTLALARRALLAHQIALETTGENIANVHTPGYTRRRAHLTPGPSITEPPGLTLGSGVVVEKISPVRDALVEKMIGRALTDQAYYTAIAENLNHLVAPWNDVENINLVQALSNFWNGWHEVARQPSSLSARANLLQVSQTLVTEFHRTANHIEFLRKQINHQIESIISEINQLTTQLAQLNGNFLNQSGEVIDDQRLQILDRLTSLAGFNYRLEQNGAVTLLLGETIIVDGTSSLTLAISPDSQGNFAPEGLTAGGLQVRSYGGALAGHLDFLHNDLITIQNSVDRLALRLVQEVNQLHLQGVNLKGETGIPFFDPSSTGAKNIALNTAISSEGRNIALSSSGSTDDNGIALKIAELEYLDDPSKLSLSQEMTLLISSLAKRGEEAENLAQSANLFAQQITHWRESVSGVSLDEEMTNLLRYENGYRAAARLISTVQTMMDSLLELVR